MFENLKKKAVQAVVLLINIALVGGGISFFKNQQEKKNASQDLAKALNDSEVADKAAELQQIIENNASQKKESTSNNSGQVTVQKPKTVTQTVPGGTQTVTSPAPKPAATTKNS